MLSLMRFPSSNLAVDMAKAAEVFDVSLRVIECCVRRARRDTPQAVVGWFLILFLLFENYT